MTLTAFNCLTKVKMMRCCNVHDSVNKPGDLVKQKGTETFLSKCTRKSGPAKFTSAKLGSN